MEIGNLFGIKLIEQNFCDSQLEKMKKEENHLVLRAIKESDCEEISEALERQGWNKPVSQYKEYLAYQENGERDVIVATINGAFAGYLTIKWKSDYVPFREKEIPEVVDFNVLMKYQRRGIGTALMDEAEKRIKSVSQFAGIGFGITKDYGAAQILYINRNYKPDGNGMVINSKPVKYGDVVTINDELVMCLIKKL